MNNSTKVVVTGIGLMTALGPNALITWQKLMAGESAIALRQPFLDLAPRPLAMSGKVPVVLNEILQTVVKAAWADAGLENSASEHSKLTPSTLKSALRKGLGDDCAVVIGSSRSHLRDWETMAIQQQRSPGKMSGNWLGTLPHRPALAAAKIIGSTGPVLAPMAACATGVWAIAQAAELIRNGQAQRVLAGAVESPITPLTIAGFQKMGALATTGCYPFRAQREGFVLGEGGAVLVLESETLAKARGAKIYGQVLAAGLTNDSHHVSSFEPSYAMGQRAVEQCLDRSGLLPTEIDAVHVHGTSTTQNDRMEASLIEHLLGKEVPVMATKGATGHTLGASGALIVALSLMSLQRQSLLPCVGLGETQFDLNFVRAGKAAQLKHLLCFSFGFGGQNAVLALKWAHA